MEKLTVSIDTTLARKVERAVAAGDYASPDEAIDEALRDWSDKRDVLGSYTSQELKALYADGLASGFVSHESMDDIKAKGRRRLQMKERSS